MASFIALHIFKTDMGTSQATKVSEELFPERRGARLTISSSGRLIIKALVVA